MQRRNLLIIGAAMVFGLVAVFLANLWLSASEGPGGAPARQQATAKVVVASAEIPFGAALSAGNIKVVDWPANSVPPGAFTSAEPLTQGRFAMRAITVGEPILPSRVTDPNKHATIAATLDPNMRAVSIPINEIAGVAGFVGPGSYVDVLLTRQLTGEGAQSADKATSVVLENVKVLATDQIADDAKTDPRVARTATVEVDRLSAQKLVLATQVGTLSLALRNSVTASNGPRAFVTGRDLGGGLAMRGRMPGGPPIMGPPLGAAGAPGMPGMPRLPMGPTMTIVRGVTPTQYEVQFHAGR